MKTLLQKMVGGSAPGEIIAQLAAIDQAEAQFGVIQGEPQAG
ncbi:MAG TPA: hypothetical protein VGI00_24025 [Streptosporangiaceae bacterium]|jgi:hypothetical protein